MQKLLPWLLLLLLTTLATDPVSGDSLYHVERNGRRLGSLPLTRNQAGTRPLTPLLAAGGNEETRHLLQMTGVRLSAILDHLPQIIDAMRLPEIEGGLDHIAGSCDGCAQKARNRLREIRLPGPPGVEAYIADVQALLIDDDLGRRSGLSLTLRACDGDEEAILDLDHRGRLSRMRLREERIAVFQATEPETSLQTVPPSILRIDLSTDAVVLFELNIGEASIHGELARPAGGRLPRTCALFFPDSGSYDRHGRAMNGQDDGDVLRLRAQLLAAGVAVLCYDPRGTGSSSSRAGTFAQWENLGFNGRRGGGPGQRENFGFTRRYRDAVEVYRYLRLVPEINPDGIILVGFGSGALIAASLCRSSLPPWSAIFVRPPRPSIGEYLRRQCGNDSAMAGQISDLRAGKPLRKPASVWDGRPTWFQSHPLELAELLAENSAIFDGDFACPTLELPAVSGDAALRFLEELSTE